MYIGDTERTAVRGGPRAVELALDAPLSLRASCRPSLPMCRPFPSKVSRAFLPFYQSQAELDLLAKSVKLETSHTVSRLGMSSALARTTIRRCEEGRG